MTAIDRKDPRRTGTRLLHVGGLEIDLSPTKHVIWMAIAATVCLIVLLSAVAAHRRHSHEVGRPRGFAAGIEAMVLYIRNEVILPNVGHHGNAFVPFGLTLFLFSTTSRKPGSWWVKPLWSCRQTWLDSR